MTTSDNNYRYPEERERAKVDLSVVLLAIRHVREHYDESIFPARPKGPHTEVYDGEAAAVARLTCDNILQEIVRRLNEPAVVPYDYGDGVERPNYAP